MKKLLFMTGIVLAAFPLFSQSFENGNLVGVHVTDLKLKPGVTEDQVITFVLNKFLPASEVNYGTKEFLMRGVRGKYAGRLATLTVFKDEKHRDKYWAGTAEAAEAQKHTEDAMKDINEEADKLWFPTESIYNDYVIASGKGEEIKKGVLIGLQNESLKLNQNYNNQQYQEYYINHFIPAVESSVPALNINFSKSIRGTDSTKFGIFYLFSNESVRDKLFDNEDNETQLLKDFHIKYQGVYDGLSKIGTTRILIPTGLCYNKQNWIVKL